MSAPSFMTIGDTNFYPTIEYSLAGVKRLYPAGRMFIYDQGFTGAEVESLREAGATVVPWRERTRRLSAGRYVRILAPMLRRKPKWFIYNGPSRLARNLSIFADKPNCIRDCVHRAGTPLVFLDGDAFLVNRIDRVFDLDFNVGVTMRRMHEIRLPERDGECSVLNVGVMFFNGKDSLLDAFFDRWLEVVQTTDDYCIEQTALTNLIRGARSDIFNGYNRTGAMDVRGEQVRFMVLPCENYNYNWIEEGFDPEENRILHFKGGRHSHERFQALKAEVGLEDVTK